MWRYDRPQKGRYREHWQLSVEAIGSDDPAIDAEIIQLYSELADRLGVRNRVLYLNSIGDAACRPAYIERLSRLARRARRPSSTPTRARSAPPRRCASST